MTIQVRREDSHRKPFKSPRELNRHISQLSIPPPGQLLTGQMSPKPSTWGSFCLRVLIRMLQSFLSRVTFMPARCFLTSYWTGITAHRGNATLPSRDGSASRRPGMKHLAFPSFSSLVLSQESTSMILLMCIAS